MIPILAFIIIVLIALFAYELYNALSIVNDGRLVWGRPEDVDAVRLSLNAMAFLFLMTVMVWIIICIVLQK